MTQIIEKDDFASWDNSHIEPPEDGKENIAGGMPLVVQR